MHFHRAFSILIQESYIITDKIFISRDIVRDEVITCRKYKKLTYIYFHRDYYNDYVHQSNIIIDYKKVNTIQNRRTSVIKFNNDSTLYKT